MESNPSENKRIESKNFFVPKAKLDQVRAEIERLVELRNSKQLRPREKTKLEELRKITRREFLKKTAVVVGGVAAVAVVNKLGYDHSLEKEKLEPVEAVKYMVSEYNQLLKNISTEELKANGALKKFITIYNLTIKRVKSNIQLQELSDSESTGSFREKTQPLKKILEQQGYFLYIVPTHGGFKGEEIGYVAIVFGKVKSKEQKNVSRRGQSASYDHLIVDLSSSQDSISDYMSTPTPATAITYQDKEIQTIMQFSPGYSKSARTIYSSLNQPGEEEKDFAIKASFGSYLGQDPDKAIQAIRQDIMATSLLHEEQHVLDGAGEMSKQALTKENIPKYMIIEMRGLFAPLMGKNPKVALGNIFNWKTMEDPIMRQVGQLAMSVLRDISGKEGLELIKMNDSYLNKIGEQAINASDIFFIPVIKENKPMTHELQDQYSNFIDKLRKK